MTTLDFKPEDRQRLWKMIAELLERYHTSAGDLPVSPKLDLESIRSYIEKYDLSQPVGDEEAIKHVVKGNRLRTERD